MQFFISGNSFAYDLTLAWNQNPEAECPQVEQPCLAGYKLCWGNQSSIYDWCVDLPLSLISDHENPQATLGNLSENSQYYFAVKAYNDADPIGESGYSNEIYYAQYTAPAPPTDGQITYEEIQSQQTTNGFLISSPDIRHGDTAFQQEDNFVYLEKFLAPADGVITEIGIWCAKGSSTSYVSLRIYSSSGLLLLDTGNIVQNNSLISKIFYTTQLSVSGGEFYWLAVNTYSGSSDLSIDYFPLGGNAIYVDAGHPTLWPSSLEIFTQTDYSLGIYVVWQ